MDISFPSIRHSLYSGPIDAERVPLTLEFDYRCDVVKSVHFQHSRELRQSTKRWIAQ